MKLTKKRIAFSGLAILLMLCFVEVSLSFLARTSPRVERLLSSPYAAPIVPDPQLGKRLNPEFPGHDERGFRNPNAPEQSDIVGLGDSQTYGTGVNPEDTWLNQLGLLVGQTAYNMAVPGYGPAHSLIQLEEALVLKPRIILQGFYAGNDLYDAFNFVYSHGQLVELKSKDHHVQENIRKAEKLESLQDHVTKVFTMGGTTNLEEKQPNEASPKTFSPPVFLSKYSKTYGFIRRTTYEIPRLASRFQNSADAHPQDPWDDVKAFAEAHKSYTQVFDNGQFKTIFTSESRFSALNLKDHRISEGHKISLKSIEIMHKRAAEKNVLFIAVLIPTKELVFKEIWQNPSTSYRHLTENEIAFWHITKTFLKNRGIEYVDALPAIRDVFNSGIQPYQASQDGHPNAYGHRAIAKKVAADLNTFPKFEKWPTRSIASLQQK